MTASSLTSGSFRSLAETIAAFGPKRRGFDPLGIVSGFRAYRTYTALDACSDRQLQDMGLRRADIPRIAAGLPLLSDD